MKRKKKNIKLLKKEWELSVKVFGKKLNILAKSPSFYGSKSVREFLRQICNALAREGFIKTPKGKRLRQLEEKRTAAIDVVMGMTETEPTIHAVNKILKGTNIPLLGGK